ncbi:MAG: transposase [Candidatus Levybacteria bacterium]|nr:transposase [Candidatus Levybacteria bacterium]
MPGRLVPLITNEIYHVFNRGINRQPIFTTKREYQRAVDSIMFYRFANPPVRLSKFLRFESDRQNEILQMLETREPLVQIFSYCFMPNHFHLLIKQKKDNGIARFISNVQNSYTRYFNTRHQRDGALLLNQFKAVLIETDEQFLHVSRYIHLNPYTGYLVKYHNELETYAWSSFPDYLKNNSSFVTKDLLMSFFRTVGQHKKFVLDQADYQRRLKEIEHLTFE